MGFPSPTSHLETQALLPFRYHLDKLRLFLVSRPKMGVEGVGGGGGVRGGRGDGSPGGRGQCEKAGKLGGGGAGRPKKGKKKWGRPGEGLHKGREKAGLVGRQEEETDKLKAWNRRFSGAGSGARAAQVEGVWTWGDGLSFHTVGVKFILSQEMLDPFQRQTDLPESESAQEALPSPTRSHTCLARTSWERQGPLKTQTGCWTPPTL